MRQGRIRRRVAIAAVALGTMGAMLGFAAPAGAAGDVCVSRDGTTRVDRGSSQCGTLAGLTVAVNGSSAYAIGGTAIAVNGSTATVFLGGKAIAVNGCTASAGFGSTDRCHG